MSQQLRIHLVAGFAYPAKKEFLRELKGRIPICEPDREGPKFEGGSVALNLPGYIEPAALIEAWAEPDAATTWAGRPARLQSTTVVVDAEHFESDLHSKDLLADRAWAARRRDTRSVADLLFEHLEAADRVVIGRIGKKSPADVIRALNPYAEISNGRAVADALTKDCGSRSLWPRATWRRVRDQLDLPAGSPPALVYRRRRPFDQLRLQRWLAHGSPDVLRAKGHVWLANNPDLIFGYSRAASVQRLFVAGQWPRPEAAPAWDPRHPRHAELLTRWDPETGFRQQEIVLVGPELDAARTEKALDDCLATNAELESAGRGHHFGASRTDVRVAMH